ncbi:hypothetical protein WJX73_001365 [Symbiochloris irregularis]|uniref:VTT domain-containing protein n=1 Tax=Symbiochloris irregularis TaxID=706552 RepID=A0AAW1P7Y4_9CHLO
MLLQSLPASPHCRGTCLRAWQTLAPGQSARPLSSTHRIRRCCSRQIVAKGVSTKPPARNQRQKQRHKTGAQAPNSGKASGGGEGNGAAQAAPIALALGIATVLGLGFVYKGQIRGFLDYFVQTVDSYGPAGYAAYGLLYVLLEIIAVPAIPLTMTAGVIFGVVPGTIVVSAASTAAATIAFLIARYAARDRVQELASGNEKFRAVDKAIGKQGFKVVTLLRLSPLLPLALSNYFYGLTSVDLPSYVAASWLGMLPGTIAYVTAGSYGRTVLDDGQGELALEWWQVAIGAGVTILALGYLGKIGSQALEEAEQEG